LQNAQPLSHCNAALQQEGADLIDAACAARSVAIPLSAKSDEPILAPIASRVEKLYNPEQVGVAVHEEVLMRFKPKTRAALDIALGGLPTQMRVEVDAGIELSATTVGELRKVMAWPEHLAVTTPLGVDADSVVKVSKASVATRVTPKPA
jgi:hypothetical protein